MAVSKTAIEKAVGIINRRIEKKEKLLADLGVNWSKYPNGEYAELKQIFTEDLKDLNGLLERAKRGEKMRLNWIEVN